MGQITADQSQEIMSTFAMGVKWSEIDFDALGLQDSVIRRKEEVCKSFEAFLRNGCRFVVEGFLRETGELTIEIPALPRPTLEEIQKKYLWVRSIERDTSPEGPVTLKLATVFRIDEKDSITGAECERRFAPSKDVALGYQHWQWLLRHQTDYPAFMALLGRIYIHFPGIVVVNGDGDRDLPFCSQDDARWCDSWYWLDCSFNVNYRMAVASK